MSENPTPEEQVSDTAYRLVAHFGTFGTLSPRVLYRRETDAILFLAAEINPHIQRTDAHTAILYARPRKTPHPIVFGFAVCNASDAARKQALIINRPATIPQIIQTLKVRRKSSFAHMEHYFAKLFDGHIFRIAPSTLPGGTRDFLCLVRRMRKNASADNIGGD